MKHFNARRFRVSVASNIDYEDLIAYVYYDNEEVAILSQEEGAQNMKIEILEPINGKSWNFRLDEFEKAVQIAKESLLMMVKIDGDEAPE